MKKLTYLLILLAAMSGAAVYAGSFNNSFVCFEDDWSDDEDMDDEDMDDEDQDEDQDEDDADDED